jgi:CheY-like chemotaxis protein
VLVVDDDDDYRSIVKDILSIRRPDIEVLEACDGLEALTLLEGLEARPAVVLMDLEMPHLDGGGAMQRIRDDEHLKNLAVLIISSLPVDQQKLATAATADGYIAKSAEIDQLDNLVELAAAYCDAVEA